MIALILALALAQSGPVYRPAEAAAYQLGGDAGQVRLFLEEGLASFEELTLAPGAAVVEHLHEKSDELLYVKTGQLELVIGGKPYTARAGELVRIPAGVKHSAKVAPNGPAFVASQVYAPPGPEQRFKKGEKLQAR